MLFPVKCIKMVNFHSEIQTESFKKKKKKIHEQTTKVFSYFDRFRAYKFINLWEGQRVSDVIQLRFLSQCYLHHIFV